MVDNMLSKLVKNKHVLRITVTTEKDYYKNIAPTEQEKLEFADYMHGVYTDFSQKLGQDAFKIVAEIDNINVANTFAKEYKCKITAFSGEQWYSYSTFDAGKFPAVKAVAQYLHISLDDIAAFGDDFSDVELLKSCGHGVAMGNAIPQAKAAAKHTCDTNDNDGVAKWLEQNVLNN